VPAFDHIVLILLENHDFDQVIGNPKMPNLNAWATQYALLAQYHAVRHPSLPNYIALMSGGTFGISKDCTDCFLDQANLADRIEASGRTWRDYQEDMPSPCFTGDAKLYVQKHNPFMYFDNIRLNSSRCDEHVVPLTQLDADLAANQLPNFTFIMPNMCHSSHDCELDVADQWLGDMVNNLQDSPALSKNSLIIIAFDESDGNNDSCCGLAKKAGGQVAVVLISPLVKPGYQDLTPYSHYSLLKTILMAWNLPDLGKTAMPETQAILGPWK
jgi:acid phosphatase